MNTNIIDKDGFFVELGKLMRSNNTNESRRILKTLIAFMGGEVPKETSDEWVEQERERMTNTFLDYVNSLKGNEKD